MNAVRFEMCTTTVGYQLDLPTNAVEVSKAIAVAEREYREHYVGDVVRQVADDALEISSDGEQLIIAWVKR